MSLVRAVFRKQVSDNNYGSEVAECTLEREPEPGEEAGIVAEELLAAARRRVHDELRNSPSMAVRRALTYPEATPVVDRTGLPPAYLEKDEAELEELPFG